MLECRIILNHLKCKIGLVEGCYVRRWSIFFWWDNYKVFQDHRLHRTWIRVGISWIIWVVSGYKAFRKCKNVNWLYISCSLRYIYMHICMNNMHFSLVHFYFILIYRFNNSILKWKENAAYPRVSFSL